MNPPPSRFLQGLYRWIRCAFLAVGSADYHLGHPLLPAELREADGGEEAGAAEERKVVGLEMKRRGALTANQMSLRLTMTRRVYYCDISTQSHACKQTVESTDRLLLPINSRPQLRIKTGDQTHTHIELTHLLRRDRGRRFLKQRHHQLTPHIIYL